MGMAHAGIFGVENANTQALAVWDKHYEKYPKLMTALTDTYTTSAFLRDVSSKLASRYTNFRQDSGDPFDEGAKLVNGLQHWNLDPKTKGIIFSDNLNTDRVLDLQQHFRNLSNPTFGIGTHLTNDVGAKPLNIVIKLHSIIQDGQEIGVAKLSDEPGKASGDPIVIKEARRHAATAV